MFLRKSRDKRPKSSQRHVFAGLLELIFRLQLLNDCRESLHVGLHQESRTLLQRLCCGLDLFQLLLDLLAALRGLCRQLPRHKALLLLRRILLRSLQLCLYLDKLSLHLLQFDFFGSAFDVLPSLRQEDQGFGHCFVGCLLQMPQLGANLCGRLRRNAQVLGVQRCTRLNGLLHLLLGLLQHLCCLVHLGGALVALCVLAELRQLGGSRIDPLHLKRQSLQARL
mmetsp:Transcript_125962/g.299026  ORF Transcript_125962/g.299026 Transcript_125962/m.299026 type:complete len:224 (-) Transcript_125962:943-1614(-)